VAGLLGILFLAGTLWTLFGAWRVTVENREVRVTWSFLGLGRTRTFPCSEVRDLKVEVGCSRGATGTPCWVVKLVTSGGETIRASVEFRAKREAEWLAAEIERAIRPWRS